MIRSMTCKRMARSAFRQFNQDDYDSDAVRASMTEDCAYQHGLEMGVEEVCKGKKATEEWFQGWKREFSKRKYAVKNFCYSAWSLSPTNVCMVEWSLAETDKQSQEFEYDGISVIEMKNFKMVRGSDYVSFKGLPQLSALMKPSGKA